MKILLVVLFLLLMGQPPLVSAQSESPSQVDSLQEKINRLWDSSADVDIEVTEAGCEAAQDQIDALDTNPGGWVRFTRPDVIALLNSAADCPEGEEE